MGHWLAGLFDRILAAVCALIFAQLPLFMQQYQYQLLGHVAELKIHVNAITNAAHTNGKTLTQYIQRFLENADVDFSKQGELMLNMHNRLETLSQSSLALQQASPLEKPIIFFQTLNLDIASSAIEHFQPGIPLTIEGAIYAFLGVLFGYGSFFCLKRLAAWLYNATFGGKHKSPVAT